MSKSHQILFVYQKVLTQTFHTNFLSFIYKITFVNSQLEKTISKGNFGFKNFWYKNKSES